jgi:acetoin utilization deacetylase AcuC-like enzyme
VRIYTHPACLQHQPGIGHPETPARLAVVTDALKAACPDLEWHEAPSASRAALARVHADALLATVLESDIGSSLRLDADTVMSPGSPEAALRAAGAGIAAVDRMMSESDPRRRQAFCAVRPPGHHATADTAMGFCLFNSIAVAAAHALAEHELSRVAIVDFDVHHGNGTQAIFSDDPRVLYISSHQSPLYPNTGARAENRVGHILNAPLPPRSGSKLFREVWSQLLLPALRDFKPDLLLISAGFDAHRLDPLADLELEAEDYRWLSAELAALAERDAQGRIVSMLEGGYSLDALGECCVAHVRGLMGM